MTLKRSALHAEHVDLGAKLVDFGGWEMPLSYPDGTIAEHLACRNDAAAFDVSHLGTVRVNGPGSFELLQTSLTNDLNKIGPARAQYQHLLDENDASVLDDIIVWWVGEDRFDVMPNASNTARVISVLGGVDVTEQRAVVAVQGPRARERLATVSPEAAAVGHFAVADFEFAGVSCRVAGTGYTGEDGVECAVPGEIAPEFWRAVVAAGMKPAGLGARDTLRLESGLPLHGHELGAGITPLQAGLGWVVSWDKGPFRGREPLEKERAMGVSRRLRGLVAEGRRPPRNEDEVFIDGHGAGVVTSGNYSPVLQRGIALAFLPPETAMGAKVEIALRGGRVPAVVVKPPFQRLTLAHDGDEGGADRAAASGRTEGTSS
ncbi:MAG: glycine cleavage system aminomethyltransferase GcvT [Acidimicrobiales bacterium]